MKIEHLAFNVEDPIAVAAWYGEQFDLKIVKHLPEPNQTHFLSDGQGTIIEIYNNPPDEVPAYASMNPLIFHLAFVSVDPLADAERLKAAGAIGVTEVLPGDGSHLIMMRDPWGLSIQLCKRAKAML